MLVVELLLLDEIGSLPAVFRIHLFLGLPDPDPLVRGMDPDPDPALDPDLKVNFFVDILKVSNENRRIRIHQLEAWIRGSGSTPKCHGSGTLLTSK
jgi:hypothetical protein